MWKLTTKSTKLEKSSPPEHHVEAALGLADVVAVLAETEKELVTPSLHLPYVNEHAVHALQGVTSGAARPRVPCGQDFISDSHVEYHILSHH